jgi:hypothetical protein
VGEDERAQAHYLWLDAYCKTADEWVHRTRRFLDLVPGTP